MTNSFKTALQQKIKSNLHNNFGEENYDEERFGTYKNGKTSVIQGIKTFLKRSIGYKVSERSASIATRFEEYYSELGLLYHNLDEVGRDLLLDLIAYRLLGYRKVKLPVNNKDYHKAIKLAYITRVGNETYDPHFMHFILHQYDLNPLGYNARLFFSNVGIAIDFILEQYACKKEGNAIVEAVQGDTVLDIGACWGDTALYFTSKVGVVGKVYSFEFIPGNINLFNMNIGLNPHLKERITLVNRPVGNQSDIPIYYKDNGPGSRVNFSPFPDQTGETKSLSIDDFVETNKVERVDLIKMDIEGAELPALKGAIATIRKFKPKLAIAIYHSMDDFVQIPKWILELDLGYELHLRHYTIHAEETVIFAKPRLT